MLVDKNQSKNQGTVILITLVSLILISAIILSSTQLSFIENKITLNTEYKNEIFLLANNELLEQFKAIADNLSIYKSVTSTAQDLPVIIHPNGCTNLVDECQSVTVSFIQYTLPSEGYSLEQHGGYSGALFEISSNAESQSNGATSSQIQGVILPR